MMGRCGPVLRRVSYLGFLGTVKYVCKFQSIYEVVSTKYCTVLRIVALVSYYAMVQMVAGERS